MIRNLANEFDAIEVHPCEQLIETGDFDEPHVEYIQIEEIDVANCPNLVVWSVYGHYKEDHPRGRRGIENLCDAATEIDALTIADALRHKLSMQKRASGGSSIYEIGG